MRTASRRLYTALVAIRGVLFDLDGTLWRQEGPPDWDRITEIQRQAVAPLLRPLGIEGSDATRVVQDIWRMFGPRFQATEGDLVETAYEIGRAAVIEALAVLGKDVPESQAEPIWATVMEVPRRNYGVRPFPDTSATLTALAKAGLRMAVLTNNPLPASVIAGDLEAMGVPGVFDAIITSLDVGYRKPDSRIFELAMAKLSLEATEVALVGDSIETDVRGALAMGIMPVLVAPDGARQASGDFRKVSTLEELLALGVFQNGLG